MRSKTLVVLTVALLPAALAGVAADASGGTRGRAGPGPGISATVHDRAAPPAGWITVSGPVHSSAQPGLARLGGQLQVVWSQEDGDTDSVRTRLLTADGQLASAVTPVVTGWLALVADPKVVGPPGSRRVVFSGIRSAGADAYTGPAVYAESSNGTTWTLGTGSLSKSTAAGSGGPISNLAAIDAAGVPFFAKGGFSGGVIVHRGVDPSIPAAADDLHASELEGAPVYVNLARDRSSEEVYVGWYSLGATTDSEAGTFVQRIWPQPNGSLLKAPESSNGNAQSIGNGEPVALAERVGGGVWLAYHVEYPTSSTIGLWKVGTSTMQTIRTGVTSDRICLTPSTDGRLWLTWRTLADHRLHAVRSNKSVTRFGSVQHLTQPGGLATSVHLTACEGSLGPLSLVVNAQTATGDPTIYAKHVLPMLTAKRSPAKLNKGRVTVTVTDAGDAVAGANVRFRGTTYATNISGRATIVVGQNVSAKRYAITVTNSGYAGRVLHVTVT